MMDTILGRCVCSGDGEKDHRERDASRHYKQKTKLKRKETNSCSDPLERILT